MKFSFEILRKARRNSTRVIRIPLFLRIRGKPMQLSVITATHQRPALLAHVLQQFHSQSLAGIRCEHLVVSDGPDPVAKFLAKRWGARYFETPARNGHAGAFAKDAGIAEAKGDYVCFWDDDNLYAPHAAATLFTAARGFEIGVVRVGHRLRKKPMIVTIPRRWNGQFTAGDIDTMCVCVQRELASKERWGDECYRPGTDFRWLEKLVRHQPKIHYVPIVIGIHL